LSGGTDGLSRENEGSLRISRKGGSQEGAANGYEEKDLPKQSHAGNSYVPTLRVRGIKTMVVTKQLTRVITHLMTPL